MAFGVDLGTTNSSIAWSDDAGEVYSLRARRGVKEPFDAVERSLVFDPLGETPIVGGEAETAAGKNREATLVRSFKRRFDKQRLRGLRYRLVNLPTLDYNPSTEGVLFKETGEWVPIEYDEYTRAEVIGAGGRMFERLLTSTEVDASPLGAVAQTPLEALTSSASQNKETLYVGVPVTFGPTGRRRLLAALVESGCFGKGEGAYKRALERCRFVYEPLALISTLTLLEPQNVLVFDYGGGTLDIAILAVAFADDESQTVTELALGGLPRAGDVLDAAFRDRLLAARPQLEKAYQRQIASGSHIDRLRADSAFANAKVRLSTAEEVSIALFDEPVTRSDLDTAIASEVEDAILAVRDALTRAELGPEQIGTVLMTGGSSLIPLVQERLHAEFPSLDDLSFQAGTPGQSASELNALTGVSRGLARFGFLERFEAGAPCDYFAEVRGVTGRTLCLPRGSADVESLSDSPTAPVRVARGATNTFVLYSNLLHETYCGALVDVDIPDGVDEVEVAVSASRARSAPAFEIRLPGSTRPLATFALDAMTGHALAAFVGGDCEWLPTKEHDPQLAPLVRPLALGDFVKWRKNGSVRCAKILRIRHVPSSQFVAEIEGFDPSDYAIQVALERNGEVNFGRTAEPNWRAGDVRLA